MFEGPEHASYIELCRALGLEREYEEGDYAAWRGGPEESWQVLLIDAVRGHVGHRARLGYGPGGLADSVWLPRLDQWLAMLEDEPDGCDVATIRKSMRMDEAKEHYVGVIFAATSTNRPDIEPVWVPTREEAAAKLWMAVTGREEPRG